MSNPFEFTVTPEMIEAFPPDQRGPWQAVLDWQAGRQRLLDEALTAGDFGGMLALVGSAKRAQVFREIAARLDNEEVRELLTAWWSMTEAWSGDPELREVMMGLLSRVAPLSVPGDDGRGLPATRGPLVVFRGNLGERPDGGSWTLDRKVAERFAMMASSPRGWFLGMCAPGDECTPTVWSGRVKHGRVWGFFNDREEREVVVPDGAVPGIMRSED